jgi:hypothetical protein
MKSFFFFTDLTQWNSILLGPHKPMITGTDGVRPNNDPSTYTTENKQLIIRDYKAHNALQMTLPVEINNQFEKYTTTQVLWNALCSFYEGNDLLREEKRDLIQKEYDMFSYNKAEKLCSHITRFLDVANRLGQAGVTLTEKDQIKKHIWAV